MLTVRNQHFSIDPPLKEYVLYNQFNVDNFGRPLINTINCY